MKQTISSNPKHWKYIYLHLKLVVRLHFPLVIIQHWLLFGGSGWICCRWKMPCVGGKAWQGHVIPVFPLLIWSGLNHSCLQISYLQMYNAITLSMPAIWHGWRDGWMGWHQHDKSDADCEITSAERTKSELKNTLSIESAENRKTPDWNWRIPPSAESWSVAYSYIFISKLSTARIHSGHEASWQVLATSTLLNSCTPNTERLHPNRRLGMVSGQCQRLCKLCLSPGLVGVGQNHAREGLSNITVRMVEPSCPGFALARHSWLVLMIPGWIQQHKRAGEVARWSCDVNKYGLNLLHDSLKNHSCSIFWQEGGTWYN